MLSPAADVIAGHCIAGVPWSLDLWRVLVASVCLYAGGMLLSRHADRRFSGSGIRPQAVLGLGLLLVLACLVVTPLRGPHGIMALLVLAYAYPLRRMARLRAVTMGALRAMNLAAGGMLSVPLGDVLPADPVLYAAVAYAVYFIPVMLLRATAEDSIQQNGVRWLICAPPLVALVALMLMAQPWPAVGIAFFVGVMWLGHHHHEEWGQPEVDAVTTSLLVGAMAFTSLLCLATDHGWEALVVAFLMLTARRLGVRGRGARIDRLIEAVQRRLAPAPAVASPAAASQAATSPAAASQPVAKEAVATPAARKQVAQKPVAPGPAASKPPAPEPPAPKPSARAPAAPAQLAAGPTRPHRLAAWQQFATARTLVYLRLLRAGTLFSPAADVIAGHAIAGVPWSGELARVLAASLCLYGAGMALNDHADRKVDAQLRPERPLPRGQIKPEAALGFGLLLMLIGLVVSPVPIYHGVMALLVLAYDYQLKGITWLGAMVMGLLRALNLTAGAVLGMAAGSFVPPDPVLYAASAYALYIVAVTLLGAMEDDTRNQKAIRGLLCVPPLVVFLALMGMSRPWPAVGIAFVLMAVLFARHRHREWGQREVRAAMTWLLLGTMAYTSLLCLASGHGWEALIVALMVVPARIVAMAISLT